MKMKNINSVAYLIRGNCGPYKRIKPGIFEMKHLNIDVKNHLVDLKIMQSSDRNKWDEMK